jgi:outer membrane biosynthesis protein TonB
MLAFVRKSTVQSGLIVALLVALTCGLLSPAGGVQASGQGISGASSTPVAAGTPIPAPAPPVSSIPPPSEPTNQAPDTPPSAPTTLPVAATATPGRNATPVMVAPTTPQAATPTVAPRPGPPGTPATPTTAFGTTALAMPRGGTPTSPPLTISPTTTARLTPTITPTRRPNGAVSAMIIRDLSGLSFTRNGHEQIAQVTMDIAVSDTTPVPRQPGWSLSLSVDQFRIVGNPSRSLPADAVTLLSVTVRCADAVGCTMPENTITYPFIMPDHGAVTIVSAALGSGGGQFVITPTFAIRVPATASAGAYTTSIAVTIAGGAPVLEAQTQSRVPATPVTATVTVPPMFAPSAPPPTPLASPTVLTTPEQQVAPAPPPTTPLAAPSASAPVVTAEPIIAPEPSVAPEPAPLAEVAAASAPAPLVAFLASDRIGTAQAVNLRTGPGVTAPTQGLLPTGTRLAATGVTRSVAGILWRQFSLADGRTGWVRDLDVLPVAH